VESQTSSQYLDVKGLSLEEWLQLLREPPKDVIFIRGNFPTVAHKEAYIASLPGRTDDEVLFVLDHFLMHCGAYPLDLIHLDSLPLIKERDPEMFGRMMHLGYYRRLLAFAAGSPSIHPWEGITWLLDLLPQYPKQALDALNAYIFAHAQLLPDLRLLGHFDAAELIRARYISMPGTLTERVEFLQTIEPRTLEHLVERLYHGLGFATQLTPASHDGGRDVIATMESPGHRESLRIECKRYARPVGVPVARALLGVVSDERANKGVIVATAGFTQKTRVFASRNPLELIDGHQLAELLNEHLGPNWPRQLERLEAESRAQKATGAVGPRGRAV
jgi:restriction system protein